MVTKAWSMSSEFASPQAGLHLAVWQRDRMFLLQRDLPFEHKPATEAGMAFVPSIGGRLDGTLCKQCERTVSAHSCGEFTVRGVVAAWYPGRSSRSAPQPVELERAPRPFLSH